VRNLIRGLQKLEVGLTDVTGLVPHWEAWFGYYQDPVNHRQRNIGDIFPVDEPVERLAC
jgi:hypothetical protein